MRTFLCYFSGLAIACLVGCASKPTAASSAVYSDLSSSQAQPQPEPAPVRVAANQPAATSNSAPVKTVVTTAGTAAAPMATAAVRETIDPQLLRPSVEPFTLGPGDTVELEILGTPASRAT